MKIKDWTGKYTCPPISHNINPLAPVFPFRMLVIGPSGSGKTNMVVDLIMNHIYYDNIYVFAKDLEEPLYEFLAKFYRTCREENPDEDCPQAFFSDQLEDVPEVNSLNKDDQNLFIFDDFITEKDQKIISEYFVRGRKKNCASIYITQSYFDTPKLIRKNCNYFALFNVSTKKELRAIADAHSKKIPFQAFMRLYQEVMRKAYSFLLIDDKTTELPLHIRRGWDGLLAITFDDE